MPSRPAEVVDQAYIGAGFVQRHELFALMCPLILRPIAFTLNPNALSLDPKCDLASEWPDRTRYTPRIHTPSSCILSVPYASSTPSTLPPHRTC